MKLHIVKAGETLTALSDKYGATLEQLKAVNVHIEDFASPLTPGSKVKIPAGRVVIQGLIEDIPSSVQPGSAARNEPVEKKENEAANAAANAGANEAVLAAAENEAAAENVNAPMPYQTLQPMPIQGYPGVGGAGMSPNAFKTDLSDSAYSPLNVPLTKASDEAVPPYMAYPAPSYEAGAYAAAPAGGHGGYLQEAGLLPYGVGYVAAGPAAQPFPYPQMGTETYGSGTFGVPGAYNPYIPFIQPEAMQSYAFPYDNSPAGWTSPYVYGANPYMMLPEANASPGCGCGKRNKPQLPYALPLVSAAGLQPQSQATVSGFPPTEEARGTISPVTPQQEEASRPDEATKLIKKSGARVNASRSDAVKAFVKRAKRKRKQPKLGSKPWVQN